MSYRTKTKDDAAKLLAIWQSALPRMEEDYGVGKVALTRTIDDFLRDMAADAEYWLLDTGDGYWAARPASIPGAAKDVASGKLGWWGFEGPVVAGLDKPTYLLRVAEIAKDWRARGLTLGYHWGWTTGPLTLPIAPTMDVLSIRRRVLPDGWGIWVFDFDTMVTLGPK